MKLQGGAHYRPLLNGLERATRHIEELSALDIPINTLVDFEEFQKASNSRTIGATPALYQKSRQAIFINDFTFSGLGTEVQAAVIMHEVGHAHRHANGFDTLSQGAECIEADLLACRWGFGQALVEMRRLDYGDDFARRLAASATDEEAARVALNEWQLQRLAGIR